jgi:hypothetical protein
MNNSDLSPDQVSTFHPVCCIGTIINALHGYPDRSKCGGLSTEGQHYPDLLHSKKTMIDRWRNHLSSCSKMLHVHNIEIISATFGHLGHEFSQHTQKLLLGKLVMNRAGTAGRSVERSKIKSRFVPYLRSFPFTLPTRLFGLGSGTPG